MPATRTTTTIKRGEDSVIQYDSQAFANNEAIITTGGVFLSALAVNKSSTTLWLMFFDAAALPTNGTIPLFAPIPLSLNQNASIDLTDNVATGVTGLKLSNGLVWAASTTSGTLTADASSSIWLAARYVAPA